MKKHWKKITLALTVVLLSIGGYLVYVLQFKEYETADENVEKVTKEKIEIDLPDDTTLVVDEDGNVIEVKDGETGEVASEGSDSEAKGEGAAASDSADGTSSSAADSNGKTGSTVATSSTNGSAGSAAGGSSSNGAGGSNGSAGGEGSNGEAAAGNGNGGTGSTGKTGSDKGGSNGSAGGNGTTGGNGETGRVTVQQIKSKYQPTLSGLEADANAKIGGLINVAKSEYAADSKDGSVSYPYYYNKYMGAATDLEKRMDSAFYAVVDVMKKDLKANGLAESHTKGVIEEYEATKKQRRSELISKAAGM